MRSDRDLLFNSQAFDLGIDHDATPEHVDKVIAQMDSWGLVLITEYMDESLVLLKRKMCWTLDDVAYYALKVQSGGGGSSSSSSSHKKKSIKSDVASKIRKMNWMDAKL